MITCKTCHIEKSLDSYTPSQQRRKGRCKDCQKNYSRQHYLNNKDEYLDRDKIRRDEYRKLIAQYKDVPCKDCGKKYRPHVMDFDHVNPEEKSFTI